MTPRFATLCIVFLVPSWSVRVELDDVLLDNSTIRVEVDGVSVVNSTGPRSMKGTPWQQILLDGKELGRGASGIASLHKLSPPCQGDVVVKEIRSCTANMVQVQSEIVAMQMLVHPNILRLYDYFPHDLTQHCHPTKAVLLTETAMAGELTTVLDNYGFNDVFGDRGKWAAKFSEDDRNVAMTKLMLNVLVDTLRGLAFMHEVGYMHRDLKPDNIWGMTPEGSCVESLTCRFVLGDLGLAKAPEHTFFYRLLPQVDGESVHTVSKPSLETGVLLDTVIKHGDVFEISGWQADQASGVWYVKLASGDEWLLASTPDGAYLCEPVMSEGYTNDLLGTERYQPQETREGNHRRFLFKSDVWALGMSIQEAFAAKKFNLGKGVQARGTVIVLRREIKNTEYLPASLRELLWQMTEDDVFQRKSADEARILAEDIVQDLFGMRIPQRTQSMPQCLSQCQALPGEGQCMVSDDGSVTRM